MGAQSGFPAGLTAGLAATPGSGEVSLNWVASEGASTYLVKRSLASNGPYAAIASLSSLSWVDTGLANGTTYYYVVSAVNANGEGANSNPASATPKPRLCRRNGWIRM